MISSLHLMWIIPLCLILGSFVTAFFSGCGTIERESTIYQQGYRDGLNIKINKCSAFTLFNYFSDNFDGDFNHFKKSSEGVIYKENIDGQLYMLFIDNFDELKKYFECEVVNVTTDGQCQRPVIRANV